MNKIVNPKVDNIEPSGTGGITRHGWRRADLVGGRCSSEG
jgi:hypothetical protein